MGTTRKDYAMLITVKEKSLEDGSKVYDIALGEGVVFHATSFRDACDFCDKITLAAAQHTLEEINTYWNPISG